MVRLFVVLVRDKKKPLRTVRHSERQRIYDNDLGELGRFAIIAASVIRHASVYVTCSTLHLTVGAVV